ncbi:MAG: UbiA family prenyltransferase [Euryarchaeota archaeon]|nr:UbiA family prenyltransferase [Euryarchaeota archaeon]
MGVIGLILATFIAAGTDVQNYINELFLSSGVVFLFIIGGNALNDYLDREIDRTAHPERPIPSGRMLPGTVARISIASFMGSLAIATFLPLKAFSIVLIALIIMLAYEGITKNMGLMGNLSIAFLTALLFLMGGAVVQQLDAVIIISIMAFLATLGREIVKDIQDMDADVGRRTLPQRIGSKNAGIIASISFLLAVTLSFEPYLTGRFGLVYLIAVLVADGIFIYCSGIHFQNPKRGQRWAKIGMIVALIAFLMGGTL